MRRLVVDVLGWKGECGDTLIILMLCGYTTCLVVADFFVGPTLLLSVKYIFIIHLSSIYNLGKKVESSVCIKKSKELVSCLATDIMPM